MRNLLLVISLFLVAAGVYVVLSGDDPQGDKDAAHASGVAAGPATPVVDEELLTPDDPGGPGMSGRSLAPTERELAGAPPGAYDPDDERPDARVSGIVIDESGNPVPGARVLATAQSFLPVDVQSPPSWMKRVETRTASDGTFLLEGISPKSLRIAVRAAGFAPLNDDQLGLPDDDVVEMDPLVLQRGAILSGRVVDAEGVAVLGAKLIASTGEATGFFISSAQREPTAITDRYGNFRIDQLAAGPWSVQVEHPNHPSKTFQGVAPDPGVEVGSLEFPLERGTSILGSVVGLPTDVEAKVAATPADGQFWMGVSRSGEVKANGAFTIGGLEQGKAYTLRLQEDGSSSEYFGGTSLSAKTPAKGGDSNAVVEYLPESSLTLRAVDARTGAPLETLSVDAGIDWPRPLMGDDNKRKRAFPDGLVSVDDLRFVDEDDLATVEIKAAGYEPYELRDLRLAPGEVRDLGDVRLEPVPVYVVSVLDADTRAPIGGAWVTATKDASTAPGDDPSSRRISVTLSDSDSDDHAPFSHSMETEGESTGRADDEGIATLNALEAELVKFTATADGYARGELGQIEVNDGGETRVTLLLSKGGSVLVTVKEADGRPAKGRSVENRAPSAGTSEEMMFLGSGMGRGERTNSKGEVLFKNLEVGQHRFRIAEKSGGGGFLGGNLVVFAGMPDESQEDEWTTVEVVEGETAELVLTAPWTGTLEGKITEAGVALAGAKLTLKEESKAGGGGGFAPSGIDFGGGQRASSGGGGAYALDEVEVGKYVLSVSHATRRMPTELPIEVRAGANTFDVDLPVSIIEGRVIDPNGDPVVGATVSAQQALSVEGGSRRARFAFVSTGGDAVSVGGPDVGGDSVKTDANGAYRLRGVLPDTRLQVHVEGGDFQPATSDAFEVAPNETRQGVDFEVQPGGSISIEAFAADGEPAGMCFVTAVSQDDDDQEPKNQMLEGGSGRLSGLRPGRWELRIQRMGFRPDGAEETVPDPQTVEVIAGEDVPVRFDLR